MTPQHLPKLPLPSARHLAQNDVERAAEQLGAADWLALEFGTLRIGRLWLGAVFGHGGAALNARVTS
jgi:hypothetical protein